MEAQERLEERFIRYLVENLGYEREQMISGGNLGPRPNQQVPDLIIRSQKKSLILGLIDFKEQAGGIGSTYDALNRSEKYSESPVLSKAIRYLVAPGDQEFPTCFEVRSDRLHPVPLKKFPDYRKLESRVEALQEISDLERIEKSENLTRRFRTIFSFLTVGIGIAASLASVLVFANSGSTSGIDKVSVAVTELAKRVDRSEKEISSLSAESKSLRDLLAKFSQTAVAPADNTFQDQVRFRQLQETVEHQKKGLETASSELNEIKALLRIDPVEAYSIKEIKNEVLLVAAAVDSNKELSSKDIANLNDKYNLTLGFLFAIIASIVALAIPNVLAARNEKQRDKLTKFST